MEKIVTKDSLIELLNDSNKRKVMHAVGKALVVLYNFQTDEEKTHGMTTSHNSVGFNSVDAEFGTICAKYYTDNKYLSTHMVNVWLKQGRSGPRIAKYWRQLNEAANIKAAKARRSQQAQ